jgi:glycine C-acetyltransferase
MQDLEQKLIEAQAQRFRIVVTDGVFSMDGDIAKLDQICELAEKHNALVMVDDSHAAGFIGKTGRGTPEYHQVQNKVHIITGTLGKALGGAMGGYTTGKKEIIDMLRQRSRPYLFSNSLAPAIVGASIKVFEMLENATDLRDKLEENATWFKQAILKAGFDIKPTNSAIIAIMCYDAKLSQTFAARLLNEGIYVTGFYYPVVPNNQARIRVQISAAHTKTDLEKAVDAFTKVGKELGIISS